MSARSRERVFILAASAEQAHLFARRWVAERPDARRLVDARYLHGNTSGLMGLYVAEGDRVVALDGRWLHPKAEEIEKWLRRTLAKTGRSWDDVELVTL